MRYVVVPQAVRRVIPPLLNDFVSLQKDTALVSSVAVFDAMFAARDYANYNFNYTPIVVVAGFFVVMTVPLARLTDWLAVALPPARAGRSGAMTRPPRGREPAQVATATASSCTTSTSPSRPATWSA